MLLTISTTHQPATDLSFLLHKHPDRFQTFDLSFGQVHVFYPEVSEARTTVALLLDVDPVGMVRRRGKADGGLLANYVNDRPYVASSLTSVALSQIFGTALNGRCDKRPELVQQPIPLVARLEALTVRGGDAFVRRIFEPLNYTVETLQHPLDEQFPEWGDGPYFSVTISGQQTLSDLLAHLYVLIPVFDSRKHYFVGEDELEKLLSKGAGWLAAHPEKEQITRRYLLHRPNLYREALARLVDEEQATDDDAETIESLDIPEGQELSLNQQRHGSVLAALRASGARSVIDLGCGEGKLLRELLKERQFERIVGMDVSIRSLEYASKSLRLDRLPDKLAGRITLIHGSLNYRDTRQSGFDAAAVVEVIEHLDPPRLSAFARVVFEFARPKTVVLTTPNQEYNIKWDTLPAGQFRHTDHRFEWTRQQFHDWANHIAATHSYTVRFVPIGPVDEVVGSPTQMAIFEINNQTL